MKNNSRLVHGTQQLVFCVKLAQTVTRSQSYRVPLGWGGKRDSIPGYAANKSRIITGCHDNSMDLNLERVLSEHQVHTK